MQSNVNQEGKERMMADEGEGRREGGLFTHGGKPEGEESGR